MKNGLQIQNLLLPDCKSGRAEMEKQKALIRICNPDVKGSGFLIRKK
jgi:hypothetical protein